MIPLGLLALRVHGAESPTSFIAKLEPVAPFPACQAAAKANNIPLTNIGGLSPTETLAPGDSETTLITLHEKDRPSTQWLIYFEVVARTNAPPAKPPAPMVVYTSIGGKFEFARSPATIRIRTLGPFIETVSGHHRPRSQPTMVDKSVKVTVNQTLLGLGLDQATAAMHRLDLFKKQNKNIPKFYFGTSPDPFGSAEVTRARAAADQMHLTPAEERALAGGFPALFSYFNSVQETPELDSIMLKVVSLPSVWSMVKNLGLTPSLAIGSPRDRVGPVSLPAWGFPSRSALYTLPMQINANEHHALTFTMIVTDPHPPFLVCGGIVGFLAENPDDPENYLTLRVINAHY